MSSLRTVWIQTRYSSFFIKGAVTIIWWCRIVVSPYLSIIWLSFPSVRFMKLAQWPFCLGVFLLLLNKSTDLQWHNRALLDRVWWSKADAAVIVVTIIERKPVLSHGLRWCFLLHCSDLLRLPRKLMPLLLQIRCVEGDDIIDKDEKDLKPRRSRILIIKLIQSSFMTLHSICWSRPVLRLGRLTLLLPSWILEKKSRTTLKFAASRLYELPKRFSLKI